MIAPEAGISFPAFGRSAVTSFLVIWEENDATVATLNKKRRRISVASDCVAMVAIFDAVLCGIVIATAQDITNRKEMTTWVMRNT